MGGTGRRTHRRVDAASSTTTRTGQRSAHEHERGSAETSRFQIRRSHHDPISSRDRQLIKDRRRACHGHRFSCPLTNSAPPQDTNTKAWPCALARGGLRLSGRSRRGGARAGKPAPPVAGGKSRQTLRPLHASTPQPSDRRDQDEQPSSLNRDSAPGGDGRRPAARGNRSAKG